MNVNATVQTIVTVNETLTPGLVAQSTSDVIQPKVTFGSGTTAGNIDLRYEATITLAASANTTLTLSALTDGLGRAVAFAHVTGLIVDNTAAATGCDVTLAGGATHPFTAFLGGTTPTLTAGAGWVTSVGSTFVGFVVASGVTDQIKFTNASGSTAVTFTVTILGKST